MKRYENKHVILTGGGHGIGRATTRRLAAEGARMTIIDRDGESAEAVRASLPGEGHSAHKCDLTDEAATCALLATLDTPDVLVNNVGGAWASRIEDVTPADFDGEMTLTLRIPFLVTHELLPRMVEAGGGAIVSIASVNGLAYFGNPVYSAAKAGLINYMRSVALEYGKKGIRSNLVSPGTINTGAPSWEERRKRDPGIMDTLAKWYPVGRVGTPEDIAAAVAFLGADEASFVNGANLVVDGGVTCGNVPMTNELLGPGSS